MPKPIQLLTHTGNGLQISSQIDEVFRIFETIGDHRVAVVSINGNKRTGKSFMLNYFLRYLTRTDNNWVYGNGNPNLEGFDWRGGIERHTVGIWMWSQPFMIEAKDGSRVALLLLDTQGSFDEKTSFQDCAVIFALSALLSSTMIMNVKNDVSEDKLHFMEFFGYFADSFGNKTEANKSTPATSLCEKLVFLVRDWENECSYPFGCHNEQTPKQNNFKKHIIDASERQCNEAQQTRRQIMKYFRDVSGFLLPHPGKGVTKTGFRGQNELIDGEFLANVQQFVPSVLKSENIEPKKIGGNCLTGNLLKIYLKKWSEIIQCKRYPDAKTLASVTADVNCMISFKEALNLYENKIRSFFSLDLNNNDLFYVHREALEESVDHITAKPFTHLTDDKLRDMIEDLQTRIIGIYEMYDAQNNVRIEKVVRNENINMVLIDQIDMENRLDAQQCDALFLVNELREQLEFEREESRKREIETELRFAEENARLEADIVRQRLDNLRIIAETEERNRRELIEQEERNKRRIDEVLSGLR